MELRSLPKYTAKFKWTEDHRVAFKDCNKKILETVEGGSSHSALTEPPDLLLTGAGRKLASTCPKITAYVRRWSQHVSGAAGRHNTLGANSPTDTSQGTPPVEGESLGVAWEETFFTHTGFKLSFLSSSFWDLNNRGRWRQGGREVVKKKVVRREQERGEARPQKLNTFDLNGMFGIFVRQRRQSIKNRLLMGVWVTSLLIPMRTATMLKTRKTLLEFSIGSTLSCCWWCWTSLMRKLSPSPQWYCENWG